jgi:uncharacterized membrane protein
MNLKVFSRVGSLAVIFFFLPSLLIKIWDFFVYAPWQAKSWLVYLIVGVGLIFLVRYRWKKQARLKTAGTPEISLLQTAKERLVKGEISLTEYKEIRQELDK